MPESQSHWGRNTLRVAMVAAVGVGGLAIARNYDDIPLCFRSGLEWEACTPNVSLEHQGPATAKIGDMKIVSETLTGTASYLTFGEVEVVVGGEQSTFDYDEKSLLKDFAKDIDATMYWNKDGLHPYTIKYIPCIKQTDDFNNTVSPHPKTITSGSQESSPATAPESTMEFVVKMNTGDGPEAGTIDSIEVDAGILDACFAHIPNTPENQLAWSYNNDNQTRFGTHEEATFRWMIEEIATKYAISQACPESILDLDAVKASLSQVVLGKLIAIQPDKAALFAQAFKDGKLHVNLDGPDVRRSYYQDMFNAALKTIKDMHQSFPNAQKHNETYPLKPAKIGKFAITKCTSTGVAIKPAN